MVVDLIAQLIQEHQNYVFKLSTLVEVIEGRGDYFIDAIDQLLKPLTVALDDHARREEDFLFPRLLERAPESPVPVMIGEHAGIRDKSATFGRSHPLWREGDESAYLHWAAAALDLCGKFSTHMEKKLDSVPAGAAGDDG